MKPEVLERNVRALLRRSYVPALPAPAFRDRLEALFLAEAARLAAARRPSLSRPMRSVRPAHRLAGGLLALAAAVTALLLGWRAFAPDAGKASEDRVQILQRGAVALELADGRWRAASAEERAAGLDYPGPRLTVETPAEVAFELRAAGGRLRVGADSRVTLVGEPDSVIAELQRGRARWQAGARQRELVPGQPLALAGDALDLVATPEQVPPLRAHEPGRRAVPTGAAAADEVTASLSAHGLLTGRVVEAASGRPVPVFTVGLLSERVENRPTPPVTRRFENSEGLFRWEDAPRGRQRLFVHAPGFVLAQEGELDLDQPREALEIRLRTGLVLTGSVLDPLGNPVADALVLSEGETPADSLLLSDSEVFGWLPIQARTRADGRFELGPLPAGHHSLRVTSSDWAPSWSTAELPRAPGAGELEIRVTAGGIVEGLVTGPDGGPLPEAQMVVLPMESGQRQRLHFLPGRSDAAGRYRFEHLPPTDMLVVLAEDWQGPVVKPVRVREGETERVDFADPRAGTVLTGRLLDPEGRLVALQNLGLIRDGLDSWNRDWAASTTGQDGTYAFRGVTAGTYLIFLVDQLGRGIRCVDRVQVTDEPELRNDIRMARGSVRLQVVSAADGRPEPEALLILLRQTDSGWSFVGHSRSDAAGRSDFTNVPPGTYAVEACPTRGGLGMALREGLVVSADGPALEATLELGPGGPVTVQVHDAAGRPVEDAAVFFVDERGLSHEGSAMPYTDATGRYRAFGLPPGEYRVRVRLRDGTRIEHTFQQVLGIEPELQLVLPSPTSEDER